MLEGHACIYIVKGDVFRKIPIDYVLDLWLSHITYIPIVLSPFHMFEEKKNKDYKFNFIMFQPLVFFFIANKK